MKKRENKLEAMIYHGKIKYFVAALAVVWLAIGTQVIMSCFLRDKVKITNAFFDNNSDQVESKLEIAGELSDQALSRSEKEKIIRKIADGIGLTIDGNIVSEQHDMVSELSVKKASKEADTMIKLVSVESGTDEVEKKTDHYLLVRLSIYKNIESVLSYKSILEKEYKELKIADPQCIVQFAGTYQGNLTLEAKNRITNTMISELGGKVVYDNRKDQMYTVYAYSAGLDEYIKAAGSKINIQVAMNYDEQKDQTVVYLATPLLNESY